MEILLGTGKVTWHRFERICDRYGAIYLYDDSDGFKLTNILFIQTPICGKLIAKVKKVFKSNHVGDLFRGISAKTPRVGDIIELSKMGKLFYDQEQGDFNYPVLSIGIEPMRSKRDHSWLDVDELYRVIDQSVDLYFVPLADSPEIITPGNPMRSRL